MRVAICVPVARKPTLEFVASLTKLESAGPVFFRHGLGVEEARKQLTEQALSTDVTHLLFIDDDMQFAPDSLRRLLMHDVDVVGGLCYSRRAPYQPMLGREHAPGLFSFDYALADQPGLQEVDATGAAFLLVRRAVFEKVVGSWWQRIGAMGEDFSFCKRARESGYRIHVDTTVEIGHVAEVIIGRKTAATLRGDNTVVNAAVPGPKFARPAFFGNTPRASIIIPTYNQKPELLKKAVASALAQTVPVEVIVVDDGTTDYEIVVGPYTLDEKPKLALPNDVKLVKHTQNAGISNALNSGLNAMRTEWFCWLSSDDTIASNKVERQLNDLLAAGAKCGFHDYSVNGEQVRHLSPAPWRNFAEQKQALLTTCPINGSTVMIHGDVFDDVGEFDPNFLYGQDWEFWCRVGERYLWHMLPEFLGDRREGGNLTQLIAAEATDSPRRERRDLEDARIRHMYSVKHCRHCGLADP